MASRFDQLVSELDSSKNKLEASYKKLKPKRLEDAAIALETTAEQVHRSFSGSWLGYHSRVYYEDLQPIPPGSRFSIEWGLSHDPYVGGTVGEWGEYDASYVKDQIYTRARVEGKAALQSAATKFYDLVLESKEDVLSCLSTIPGGADDFLRRVIGEIEGIKKMTARNFVTVYQPKGQMISRDSVAILAGSQVPPHIEVLSQAMACKASLRSAAQLITLIKRAINHMKRLSTSTLHPNSTGTRIFIGHGRSLVWKELRDFFRDRLGIEWEEFNRIPTAGQTTISRLQEMLDTSAFAFLVMTPEDEQVDGEIRARENVVHEAGLFQGKLGFSKAIILREEGCTAFSNIAGLGEIRFPRGGISSVLEQIREVLERENIIVKQALG